MKENNIQVKSNILEKEGYELNKRFFKNQYKKLPYVILKWAQTEDRFLAKEDGSSKWISSDISRTLVHKWRSEETGILIGVNTAINDNPTLNVRSWKGQNPIRILIDPQNRCNKNQTLLKDSLVTLIYNKEISKEVNKKHFIKLDQFNLKNILKNIYERGISSILVEGGAKTLNSFIENNLWDEARVFQSKMKFIKGIKAPKTNIKNSKKIGDDLLFIIENHA